MHFFNLKASGNQVGVCILFDLRCCHAGFGARKWKAVLDEFYEVHEDVRIDADARSGDYLEINEADELLDRVWHVRQTFADTDGDRDFAIYADVDLDATQEQGEVVFTNYRAGSIEVLLGLP